MKIKESDTCYICGKKACSSEHAPAKSFFPIGRRDNLIQVPSCSEHNEGTSKDDEYVRFIISAHFRNNTVGEGQSIDKSIKTLKRSPALAAALSENKIPATIINNDNSETSSLALMIDRKRFDREICKNAYAVFFHKYQRRWNRELNVFTYELFDSCGKPDIKGQFVLGKKRVLQSIGMQLRFEGGNPEVFKYAFVGAGEIDDNILVMVFYEGFEVWIFPMANTLGPKL